MQTISGVSPLDLILDPKNPRFILPSIGETQQNIREYLVEQEDVLPLARNIAVYGALMPGDRIVVTYEDEKLVVLEGNRRTCACQMFLNRELIPSSVLDRYPNASEGLLNSISSIDVDVIESRVQAKHFLATRHIERAKQWSSIAKMRFCYEDYISGLSAQEIHNRTGLKVPEINNYIRSYKILLRGFENEWSPEEHEQLFLLNIRPTRLLRIFELKDTKRILQLYFDNQHILHSNLLSDDELDQVIYIWTRKAFIDNELGTRISFGEYHWNGESTGASAFISEILKPHFADQEDTNTNAVDPAQTNQTQPNAGSSMNPLSDAPSGYSGATILPVQPSTLMPTAPYGSNEPSLPLPVTNPPASTRNTLFFAGLNYSMVMPTLHNGRGVISVCREIEKISTSQTYINNYPICTAFIIRALIEQSIKYHAKKNGFWSVIMSTYRQNGNFGDPELSQILKSYKSNLSTWIPDQTLRRVFSTIFDSHVQIDKFNLVIHSPECYTLASDTLKAIPQEGCLALVNYFLA